MYPLVDLSWKEKGLGSLLRAELEQLGKQWLALLKVVWSISLDSAVSSSKLSLSARRVGGRKRTFVSSFFERHVFPCWAGLSFIIYTREVSAILWTQTGSFLGSLWLDILSWIFPPSFPLAIIPGLSRFRFRFYIHYALDIFCSDRDLVTQNILLDTLADKC